MFTIHVTDTHVTFAWTYLARNLINYFQPKCTKWNFLFKPLKSSGIAPMPPLGSGISRRNSNPRCGFSPYESHNIQTLNSGGLNNGKNHNLYNCIITTTIWSIWVKTGQYLTSHKIDNCWKCLIKCVMIYSSIVIFL